MSIALSKNPLFGSQHSPTRCSIRKGSCLPLKRICDTTKSFYAMQCYQPNLLLFSNLNLSPCQKRKIKSALLLAESLQLLILVLCHRAAVFQSAKLDSRSALGTTQGSTVLWCKQYWSLCIWPCADTFLPRVSWCQVVLPCALVSTCQLSSASSYASTASPSL